MLYTYQDLLELPQDEQSRMDFVRAVISQYKSSDEYKMAVLGVQYNKKRNASIMNYQKLITDIYGRKVPDRWSPNHKTTRGFFSYFTTQQNQYLLGNGVTWENEDTEDKLGTKTKPFDNQLKKAGKKALVQGGAYGFYNLDHVDIFGRTEFAPLYDEENSALMAGVRFWQVASNKPLRATFYEIDGYTDYIWEDREDAKKGEQGRILRAKRPYILKVRETQADGTEIYDFENYPSFPIVPLWANDEKQSELVGIQEGIDAYDLIKNGYLNDLDTAQIYWLLKGADGDDETDLVKFLDRLHTSKVASLEEGQEAESVTVQIPYEARERLLDRIERDLYKDYMALNIDEIKSGAVTATQIEAAYEPMDSKADDYEYCIIEFINGILELAGIDDNPTFTRSKLINVNESVGTVLQAYDVLSSDYATEKVLTLLGDGDRAEEIIEQMEADELEMGGNLEEEEEIEGEEENLLEETEEVEEEEAEEGGSEMEDMLAMLEKLLKEI